MTVAFVTGASRGAGKGIALALAETGATVYVTGRTKHDGDSELPGSIATTAKQIDERGGRGIPIVCDHADDAQVEAAFAQVAEEHGRLDILVNSIAGEDPLMHQWGNFWKVDVTHADTILRQAIVSHIITAKHVAPVMIRARRGLIVEVTENDVMSAGGNPLTQTVKLALKGLALNMAPELYPHGVTSVAITPGFLRSEAMLERHGVTEANWRDAGAQDRNFLESESPLYVGRAVAALAADPRLLERTGQLFSSWTLARDYGFTDYDGRRPDWGQLTIDWSGMPPWLVDIFRTGTRLQSAWLDAVARRTREFAAKIP